MSDNCNGRTCIAGCGIEIREADGWVCPCYCRRDDWLKHNGGKERGDCGVDIQLFTNICLFAPDDVFERQRDERAASSCVENKEGSITEKPIKDWTLQEVQEHCANTECDKCGLNLPRGGCQLKQTPVLWKLTDAFDMSTLTPDELAVCRLLKAGGAMSIKKHESYTEFKFGEGRYDFSSDLNTLFPSLCPGDMLDLTTMDL